MEKEKRKVNLSTVILLFIIFILLIALFGMWFYYNHIYKSNTTSNETNLSNTYTNNVTNQEVKKETNVSKAEYIDYLGGNVPVENGYGEEIKASNTINYALLKKYGYDENILGKYYSEGLALGDSPNIQIIECNYDNNVVGKYTKPIKYNMSIVKDGLYPENDNTLEDNLEDFRKELLKEKNNYNESTSDLYVKLNGLSIMNGNCGNYESYINNSRAKKIQVIVDGKATYVFDLKDTNEVQTFDLNYQHSNIGTPITVEVTVLEKYNGQSSSDVYINEIGFGLEANGFGGR